CETDGPGAAHEPKPDESDLAHLNPPVSNASIERRFTFRSRPVWSSQPIPRNNYDRAPMWPKRLARTMIGP
ncbi:hypothetical protein, partial [Roseiarcus sp.]|uniref:hypothetical protein n=1 Tax=Roseiarcus sp. TaxID=1969460 RepID=UPI003C4F85D2